MSQWKRIVKKERKKHSKIQNQKEGIKLNPLIKSSLLASSALFLTVGFQLNPVQANEDDTNVSSEQTGLESNDLLSTVDFDNLKIVEEDGSESFFESKEDMQLYITYSNLPTTTQNVGLKSITAAGAIGETVVGTEYKKMKFLAYSKYTPSWAKASSYTLSQGKSDTFSTTIATKFGDVGASFTKNYGTTTTIPANKKKYSRIAGYADLKIQKIKVSLPNVSSTFYKNKVTKQAKYVKPKYK